MLDRCERNWIWINGWGIYVVKHKTVRETCKPGGWKFAQLQFMSVLPNNLNETDEASCVWVMTHIFILFFLSLAQNTVCNEHLYTLKRVISHVRKIKTFRLLIKWNSFEYGRIITSNIRQLWVSLKTSRNAIMRAACFGNQNTSPAIFSLTLLHHINNNIHKYWSQQFNIFKKAMF